MTVARAPFARLAEDGGWQTDQADLFSEAGWAQFSGPWPRQGMTRSGCAYELPTSALRTAGTESSFLPTLPTPVVAAYGSNQSLSPNAAVRPSLEALVNELTAE